MSCQMHVFGCFVCLQINKQGFIWSARTSASPEQLFLRPQARSRISFNVDYRKVSLTSGAYVIGSVAITNPNAQVVSAPGLSIAITGDSGSGGGGQKNGGSNIEAQVDCLSGAGNLKSAMPFKVPSGGTITCT